MVVDGKEVALELGATVGTRFESANLAPPIRPSLCLELFSDDFGYKTEWRKTVEALS